MSRINLKVLLTAVSLLSFFNLFSQNLVTNNDFTGGTSSWTDCGNSTEIMNTSQWHGGNFPYTPNDFAEIDAGIDQTTGNGDDASLCQNIVGLTIGEGYNICLDVMRRPGPSDCTTSYGLPATVTTLVAIDNGVLSTSFTDNATTWGWTTVCFAFTATATTQQLTLNASDGSSCGMLVTNIVISSTLPIELLSFDAFAENNEMVKLDWTTLTEINNSHFTIEKSIDAKYWEAIEEINGAGNSSTLLTYKTFDFSPYKGVSYYRLKQTDFDGAYSYSNIKTIRFSDKSLLSVYPNPTTSNMTILGNYLEHTEFEIYNVIGNRIGKNLLMIKSSENQIEVDISQLPAGLYFVRVGTETQKIRKL